MDVKIAVAYHKEGFIVNHPYLIPVQAGKAISKKNNVLCIRTEEYENYKGNIGFSNLIYQFKEDNLTKIPGSLF